MTNCTTRRAVTLAMAMIWLAATARGEQRTQDFSKDPGWDAKNNRVVPAKPYMINRDFGWSPTNHAGAGAGEIGGEIWQSPRPASYAKVIETKTFEDDLYASGSMALLHAKAISGYHTQTIVALGWFNGDPNTQLWRPANFAGVLLMSGNEPDGMGAQVSYGTSDWAAGATFVNAKGGGQERNPSDVDSATLLRIAPDGAKHTWGLRYDPKAAEEAGAVTFTLDGRDTTFALQRHMRKAGAKFDRFGIFAIQLPGLNAKIYFDDITVGGKTEDFAKDPGWEAVGNHDRYPEMIPYGANDFGYSPTANAGGKPGELGGRFYSCNPNEEDFKGYCGDRIGRLTLNDKLIAKGKFSTARFSTDSSFGLGWFNHEKQDWPLHNFVGVTFDSLSDVGRIIQPIYGTSGGEGEHSPTYLTFLPDGTQYEWTLEYDPAGASGRGAITITLNGKSLTMGLNPGDKEKGAIFDRFGVCNLQGANSKWCDVYLDDLEYTVGE